MLGYVLQQGELIIAGHTAPAEQALKILVAHDIRSYSLSTNPAEEEFTCKLTLYSHIKFNAKFYARNGN